LAYHPDLMKINAASELVTSAKRLVRTGDQRQAYAMLSEAFRNVQAVPEQTPYREQLSAMYDEMGMGFYVCGDKNTSVDIFKRSISLDPNNLQARSHLRVAVTSGDARPASAQPVQPQQESQALIPPSVQPQYAPQPIPPTFPTRPSPPPQQASPVQQQQPAYRPPPATAGPASSDFRKELLSQGMAYENMGQTGEAVRCYTELITKAPYNIDGYKHLLKIKPNDITLLEKYSLALEKVELLEELVETMHRLIDIDPKMEYLDRLKKVNPYDMKIKEVEKDVAIMNIELQDLAIGMRNRRITTSEVEAFTEKLDAGDFDPSMFDKILKSGDYTQEQLFRIGDRLFEMKRFAEASKGLDRILQDSPHDVTVWLYKGSTLFKTGSYEFALQCFERATKIQPENVTAWLNAGIVLFWMERFDDALKALDAALKYDQDESGAWYYKACCKASKKDVVAAMECLKTAISKDPSLKRLARSDAAFHQLREDKKFSIMLME